MQQSNLNQDSETPLSRTGLIKIVWRSLLGAVLNNHVTAGSSWFYPELDPVELHGDRSDVLNRVRQAFEAGGDRWELTSVSEEDATLKGIVKTELLGFTDDFSVTLEPVSDRSDVWSVLARSSSRTGIGDFGQNARNIRNFYGRLRDRSSND